MSVQVDPHGVRREVLRIERLSLAHRTLHLTCGHSVTRRTIITSWQASARCPHCSKLARNSPATHER